MEDKSQDQSKGVGVGAALAGAAVAAAATAVLMNEDARNTAGDVANKVKGTVQNAVGQGQKTLAQMREQFDTLVKDVQDQDLDEDVRRDIQKRREELSELFVQAKDAGEDRFDEFSDRISAGVEELRERLNA